LALLFTKQEVQLALLLQGRRPIGQVGLPEGATKKKHKEYEEPLHLWARRSDPDGAIAKIVFGCEWPAPGEPAPF